MTREATVVWRDGLRPVLDIDPVDLEVQGFEAVIPETILTLLAENPAMVLVWSSALEALRSTLPE